MADVPRRVDGGQMPLAPWPLSPSPLPCLLQIRTTSRAFPLRQTGNHVRGSLGVSVETRLASLETISPLLLERAESPICSNSPCKYTATSFSTHRSPLDQ